MKITTTLILAISLISCAQNDGAEKDADFLTSEPIEKAHYIRFEDSLDGIYEYQEGGKEFASIDNFDTLYSLMEHPSINSSFITNTIIGEKSKTVEFYINLNHEGGSLIKELTTRNVDKEIYVVYHGKIIAHPRVFGPVDNKIVYFEMEKELFHEHFTD